MANRGDMRRSHQKAFLTWSMAAFAMFGPVGCRAPHPPGPVMELYMKDGGPPFERSPGVYDPLLVQGFFKSHPAVLPSFIDHGVCSLKTDPASSEAMANGVICQSAVSASMAIGMKKFQESNL